MINPTAPDDLSKMTDGELANTSEPGAEAERRRRLYDVSTPPQVDLAETFLGESDVRCRIKHGPRAASLAAPSGDGHSIYERVVVEELRRDEAGAVAKVKLSGQWHERRCVFFPGE